MKFKDAFLDTLSNCFNELLNVFGWLCRKQTVIQGLAVVWTLATPAVFLVLLTKFFGIGGFLFAIFLVWVPWSFFWYDVFKKTWEWNL